MVITHRTIRAHGLAQLTVPARQLRQTAALTIQHRNGRLVHATAHRAYAVVVLAIAHRTAQVLAGAAHRTVVLAAAIRALAVADKFEALIQLLIIMYITEENKKTYRAIILLNELINGDHQFKTIPQGNDPVLKPLFTDMEAKGYVQISGVNYQVGMKGQQAFDNFMQRYTEYLKVYDVFSFVDLEKGEFAFARFYDFNTDEAWDIFKNNERFDDLRIAVALFKKLDPAEIVFMSFVNENRFDTTSEDWQIDLMSGDIWKEIEAICQTAIKPEEVGEDAMVDMINQGSELMIKLLEQEAEDRNNNGGNGGDTAVYETVEYYQPYYDPYYVSPIWLMPLFLW